MISTLGTVIGGIGLFLLGMILMTDGLKALAGDALRSILARFTTNRFSALATGAGVTALVQSSSATTLATIGFVSAGLLSFQNSIGVIIGSNLGTTSTGWIVSTLGLKLSIGRIMLPVIGFGALANLMGKGRLAQAGMALAGFGVIFIGIDTLQEGMQSFAAVFNPADFPSGGIGGVLLLVAIGALMTVVMQSSSAAVATTLTALSGGAINLEQAAALVIGQNIGTTVTAGIAAIGASTAAKRTALAHVCFNAGTGAMAILMLPWFIAAVLRFAGTQDPAVSIAMFHTAFNLLGVLIFMPFLPQFARAVERIIKERGARLTRFLDPSAVEIPSVAVEAARQALKETAAELYTYLAAHLRKDAQAPGIELVDEIDTALDAVRHFLAKVPPPDLVGYGFDRQISTIHAIEHLERLTAEAQQHKESGFVASSEKFSHIRGRTAELLDDLAVGVREPDREPDVERVEAFSRQLSDEHRASRAAILHDIAAHKIDSEAALIELSALRWLDRVAYHLWRTGHHLREMTREQLAAQASTGADAGAAEYGIQT